MKIVRSAGKVAPSSSKCLLGKTRGPVFKPQNSVSHPPPKKAWWYILVIAVLEEAETGGSLGYSSQATYDR